MNKLKFTLLPGLLMSMSFAAFTKSYDSFCFQEHIKESISINKERKWVYSDLTQGRSNRIFNFLINYEYLTLAPATIFDLKALSYQKNGMDLFCHEFMSMNRAPDFDPEKRTIPEAPFRPYDWKFYKSRLSAGLKHDDPIEVRRAAVEALLELKTQPDYYCFSRHMVESIYRFAYFIPLRAKQARDMGLKDPTRMMLNVIKLHMLGLKDAHKIDLWAQPIQMSGVPILCTEIPDLLQDLDDPELKPLKH